GGNMGRDVWIDKLTKSYSDTLPIVPNHLHREDWFINEVSDKVKKIQEKFIVIRLHSPIGDLIIYSLESKVDPGDRRYLVYYNIGKMDEDRDSENKIVGSKNAERATIESAILL